MSSSIKLAEEARISGVEEELSEYKQMLFTSIVFRMEMRMHIYCHKGREPQVVGYLDTERGWLLWQIHR